MASPAFLDPIENAREKPGRKASVDTVLRHMNDSDSSEAHAMCDCISGAMEDVPKREQREAALAMLEEFREWAVVGIQKLKGT
jgi:hypothetical protein